MADYSFWMVIWTVSSDSLNPRWHVSRRRLIPKIHHQNLREHDTHEQDHVNDGPQSKASEH